MKFYKMKVEKSKVGSPNFSDAKTKKTAIILACVTLVLVITIALAGVFKLNIIKFNKLKGEVNISLCNEIPARFQPKSESNQEGIYDYGFTDPYFYSAVVSSYNSDSSYCSTITEEQLSSISSVSVVRGIRNADGVQYLTGLTTLSLIGDNMYKGSLTSIDLSKNIALTNLNLNRNRLTNIDISNNTALTTLDLSGNQLSSIDVSKNTALINLNLGNNKKISAIDVTNNTSLTTLALDDNDIKSIDLSNNIALTNLYLGFNDLSDVDVSKNVNLTSLNLAGNSLSNVDISNNRSLTYLNLGYNKLNSLDISKNTALIDLHLDHNELSSIDVRNNTSLVTLWASYNNLVDIDLSQNTSLKSLSLGYNELNSIDLSNNTALNFLSIPNNKIEKTYYTTGEQIKIETPNVTTAHQNDIIYSIGNSSIATYDNGIVQKVGNGSTKLSIKYKVSDSLTFDINYTINFIGVSSSQYTVDEEKKEVDLKGEVLDNVSTSKFIINPSNCKLDINGDKLEIKDANGNLVDTYTLKNYVLYKLTSTSFTIDEEKKTIDLNEAVLGNISSLNFSSNSNSYKIAINGEKLEIKDSNGTVVDTYKFKNYVMYRITIRYYVINEKDKKIDLNGELLNTIYTWKFSVIPSNYKLNINNNELEVKDNTGKIIETYKFTNYLRYKLSSSYYTIDDNNKTIDAKGEIFRNNNNYIYINPSYLYETKINENRLEILDSNKNVVDSYEIINMKKKDEDAYLKAGFKDKNLYTCVLRQYVGDEDIDGNYLLTDEEMNNISELYCGNQNISNTTGLEKLTNLYDLDLSYNNIESINLKNNINLSYLMILNNKLTNIDVTNNVSLRSIIIANNNISKIVGLEKLESLDTLYAPNNDLSNLNLSKAENIEILVVDKNTVSNPLYILKGKEIDYKKDIKLNNKYNLDYDIVDKRVVTYKDNKLNAIKEGITNIYLSNEYIYSLDSDFYDKAFKCQYLKDDKACLEIENINEEDAVLPYFLSQEVKVYDLISKEYEIDKDKKIIDALNKDFDASKINITLNGLTGTLEDDKFIIKDGETIVDTYTINNIKKIIKEDTSSTSNNGTNETKNKANNTNKTNEKVINKIAERKEDVESETIYIEGEKVPLITLLLVKGKDRNIVITNKDFKFTINGKDIGKVEKDLNLSYELRELKESTIYDDVKNKFKKGMVLSFKDNVSLPYKVLVELNATDDIQKNIGIKSINIYNYDSGKYNLVAKDLSTYNNKISFYINKTGNYILTNKKIENKNIQMDDNLLDENTKLTKRINCIKMIIPIVIFIILITLGVIGFIRSKKKLNSN